MPGRFGFGCSGRKYFSAADFILSRNHVRGDLPTDFVSDATHARILKLDKTPATPSRLPVGSVWDHLARHLEKGQSSKIMFSLTGALGLVHDRGRQAGRLAGGSGRVHFVSSRVFGSQRVRIIPGLAGTGRTG